MQLFKGVICIFSIMSVIESFRYQANVEDLFEEYSDMVYKIAFVQMKKESDTDDIFQEVFLRLVKHSKKLQSKEHAKAWLIRVTLNCCKQHYLSSWYKKTTELDESLLAEEVFDQQENELLEAVQKLPAQYRTIIHLFYYEGYSIMEISKILEKKENTIKSHLFRARKLLKDELEGGSGFE